MVAVQNRMQGGMMLRSSQQGSFHSLTRGMSGHFQGNVMLAGCQKMARSGRVCSAGQAHTLGLQGLASNRSQSVSPGSAGQQGQLCCAEYPPAETRRPAPAGLSALPSQVQPTASYHHLATPVTQPASQATTPENLSLSAFKKVLKVFLIQSIARKIPQLSPLTLHQILAL